MIRKRLEREIALAVICDGCSRIRNVEGARMRMSKVSGIAAPPEPPTTVGPPPVSWNRFDVSMRLSQTASLTLTVPVSRGAGVLADQRELRILTSDCTSAG